MSMGPGTDTLHHPGGRNGVPDPFAGHDPGGLKFMGVRMSLVRTAALAHPGKTSVEER